MLAFTTDKFAPVIQRSLFTSRMSFTSTLASEIPPAPKRDQHPASCDEVGLTTKVGAPDHVPELMITVVKVRETLGELAATVDARLFTEYANEILADLPSSYCAAGRSGLIAMARRACSTAFPRIT